MRDSAPQEKGVVVSRTSAIKETREGETPPNQLISSRRFSGIRNATQKSVAVYRTELGSSAEQFFTSCQSVEAFFDAIAGIRLHQMPHYSSRWDKVLKWAEFFVAQVQGYSEDISKFADCADQAACLIWASLLSLIQLGPKYIAVLEKAFGVFYSCGLTLRFFLRHCELFQSSEELQIILAESLTVLLKLVTSIAIEYTQKQQCTRLNERDFDERFGRMTDSIFSYADRFTDTIWATHLRSLAKPGDISVDSVREFLMPYDTVTRLLAVTRFIRRERADYTCEWFSQYLTGFTRSEKVVLLVTGEPATGKTVLSEWVIERLQSLDGPQASEVITYRIDPDLNTEHTSMSVVKGLLLQILQLSVGDNELYKSLAYAYELFVKGNATSQVESALWKALKGGLRSDRNQIIIVDGIDHLSGGEADSLRVLEQLDSMVSKHSKTKCVVFSRPLSSSIPENYALFSIKPEQTTQDMHYVAEHSLPTTPNFEGLSKENRVILISTLVKGATGSFGWLFQALEILKREKTPESILKSARALPKTWSELIGVTIRAIDLNHRDTKSILSLLLAAERPLLIGEVNQLMELDMSTCTRAPLLGRVDDAVTTLGQLIDVRDGFVRFRHYTIKENLLDRAKSVKDFKNAGPFPFNIKEAHYDLTLRCMAYIKICVTRYTQPTLEPLNHYELNELFNSFKTLQYSARYWTSHFKASPMHGTATSHKITTNFKTCFPDSTLLAAIEGSCYQFQFPIANALNHFLLTLSIRTMVIGETSESVLQTLLNLARAKQVTLESTEINEYYYVAWKLSLSLELTTIATNCSHKYLEVASSVAARKNSEVTTHRIEMLQYMITTLREATVHVAYLEQLATIHATIGETEKAAECYQEIYDLNVRIYGRTAVETRRSYQKLTSTVQKSTKSDEIYEITRKDYDEAVCTLPATDTKRISLTWSMIEFYEKQKDTRKLEETLLTLWQSLTRVNKDSKTQERKVEVALRYAELLKHQKRAREAENILHSIWIDLEQEETESTTTINQMKIIGDQLQSVGAVDTACSVFARLWAYYVKTGKQSSAEASTVSSRLTQVTQETTSETNKLTTLVETFEVTFATAATKSINTTTVKNTVTLVDAYYRQKNWSEIIRVGTITLDELWPAFNKTKELSTPLPITYYHEVMEIVNRLLFAHLQLRQFEPAEFVYRRLFYAIIATPNSPDDLLASSSEQLIDFYRSHSMPEKSTIIYLDLYEEIQKRHGKTNTMAISTLYALGDTSLQLNDTKDAEFAYHEIHTNLAQGADLVHKDAIRACLALCNIYGQQRQYSSAQKVYSTLWHTFIKHGRDYELQAGFAEEIYQKYVRILKQVKTDYTVLHQLAVDYRKACVRFYGISSEITLKATLQLAKIDEETEKYREEAINMYEEAYQKSKDIPKGQVSESTLTAIQTARESLPHLYSNSKLSNSPRAVTLYSEELLAQHSKYGHAHRDALMWLNLLSIAFSKQDNKESLQKANETLEASIFNILKKEKSSQRLADSGSRIAEIYLNSGLKSDGEQLLAQLRSQAVFGFSNISKKLKLTSGTKFDPSAWIFITTFSVTLAGRKDFFSSAMADLISEFFMYEEYHRSILEKAPFLTTLACGSRLLQFTRNIGDINGTARVESELLGYFSANLNAPQTITKAVLGDFLQLVLVQIHTLESDVSILKIGSQVVNAYLDKAKFQEAHDLSYLLDRFQQFQGGYNSLAKIDLGLQVALVLGGRGKIRCQDAKIGAATFELSTSITKQIMETVRSSNINIIEVSIDLLNDACGLLGDHRNLNDLEWVLSALWQARDAQPSWSTSTVVGIGRRLVETQFSQGHQDRAITLCEDICYNLRRVWGPLDATTLEMHILLSSFYAAAGNYRKAMLVHEDVIRDTVSDKGDELPIAEASQIAVQHLELLKRAYQRLGGWDKNPQVYVDLYQQVTHAFGSDAGWKKAQPTSVEKWVPKGADSLGIWTRPESFEFMTTDRKHTNYLRKSSGYWNMQENFHSPLVTQAYSAQPITTV